MGVCEQLCNLLAVVVVLLPLCTAELVDISLYHSTVVDIHNEIRREVGASDMQKMVWDDGLAKEAENWVKYCRYERAPSHISRCGQNLYYAPHMVRTWEGIDRTVHKAVKSWKNDQLYFRYGTDCGSACAYSQMVWSTASNIGCAMHRCPRMKTGAYEKRYTTIFACFYSPKGEMTNDFPFTPGVACSLCTAGMVCEADLCVPGVMIQSSQVQNLLGPEVAPGGSGVVNVPERVPAIEPPVDVPSVCIPSMTTQEVHFVLLVTNNLRAREMAAPLTWSDELEQWAQYVIRCDIEYPGPRTAYTNFGKTGAATLLYELVYEWGDEGSNTGITLVTGGCRTPSDAATCNHNTNLMSITNTRMGCAACVCGLQRQFTCIYDSR
ncbi:peptidase inhibitor 16-like [Haliotis cracherodii]|uniref:peptidase inhibitor 16-like n=1 Tax=Haliotis cracherodii TaxID=6455 RepID=UPI0039EB24F6